MSRTRSFAGLGFAFALFAPLLTHCNAATNDRPTGAEEGCRRMLDAVVALAPELGCGAPAYCAVLGNLGVDGSLRYRETELSTCLDEIRNAPACAMPIHWPLSTLYRVAPACAATFAGARAEGEPCATSIECGWSSVCASDRDGEPTTCRKAPGIGERCLLRLDGRDCQDGLSCNAPTPLIGDVGTCVNVAGECASTEVPACTGASAPLGGDCRLPVCRTVPSSPGGPGKSVCESDPGDCGGGLACTPTDPDGGSGKCLLSPTFR